MKSKINMADQKIATPLTKTETPKVQHSILTFDALAKGKEQFLLKYVTNQVNTDNTYIDAPTGA